MALPFSSTLQSIANYFKPHRAEALERIRVNAFCFILVIVLSNLLPLPSLQSALRTVASSRHERWYSDWVYRWFCILEVAAAVIFAFNVLEGVYALKCPRPPLPPYTSPAKAKQIFKTDPTPKRTFKLLSPNTSPQPQKSFSSSLSSSSFSTAIAGGSTYPTSPLSTPSRVLHYPDLLGSTNTQGSSTFQTPSPVLSAYRGKHANGVGRALDVSFLSQLGMDDSDVDDRRD